MAGIPGIPSHSSWLQTKKDKEKPQTGANLALSQPYTPTAPRSPARPTPAQPWSAVAQQAGPKPAAATQPFSPAKKGYEEYKAPPTPPPADPWKKDIEIKQEAEAKAARDAEEAERAAAKEEIATQQEAAETYTPAPYVDPAQARADAEKAWAEQYGTAAPEGPSAEMQKIDELYADLLGKHDKGWADTQEGLDARAAADRRKAMAVNAAAGRGLGGSFLGGQRQANIAMAGAFTEARSKHGKEASDLLRSQLDASLGQGRFDTQMGQQQSQFETAEAGRVGSQAFNAANDALMQEQRHSQGKDTLYTQADIDAAKTEAMTPHSYGPGAEINEDGSVTKNGRTLSAGVAEHVNTYPEDLRAEMMTYLSQNDYETDLEYKQAAYDWYLEHSGKSKKSLKAWKKRNKRPTS